MEVSVREVHLYHVVSSVCGYSQESAELELGNDRGCGVTVCTFVLSFSINYDSNFCTAISLHIVDVVRAEGKLSHVSGDILLGHANPGIESYHAVSLLFENLEPLLFTSLSFFKNFWCFDICVRQPDVVGLWLDFLKHGFS